MSSTNRGAARADLDFYETPRWCTRAILPLLPLQGGNVLDAGCGTGAIIREVAVFNEDIATYGIELDHDRAAVARTAPGLIVETGDFLLYNGRHDLIISNPPYSMALEFVVHAMSLAPTACMLLRLPWIASQGRASWHRLHPAHINVLPRRPSFTANGKTDSADYAWFIWGTERAGRFDVLQVEPTKAKRAA